MRKMISVLLCLLLVLQALPASAGGISPVMRVVKCQEWVSLRSEPDSSSSRLAKVYLGELVTGCDGYYGDFIYCEYGDKAGYILAKYLDTTDFYIWAQVLPNQMVVNCTEWVSLRNGPSDSAARLAEVPLGAIVRACVQETESYVSCEYGGVRGYIASSYLKKANYKVSSRDDSVVEKAAGKYPVISGAMEVVRCTEWVSLREKASSSAARLARVPLGYRVEDCVQVSDSFVYCCYRGVWGYIDIAYLEEVTPTGTAFDALPALPSWNEFNAVGTLLFQFRTSPLNGITVSVRKIVSGDTEVMSALFVGADGAAQGRITAVSPGVGELTVLEAYETGPENDRRLLWLTNGTVDLYGADTEGRMGLRWSLDRYNDRWSLSGSTCFAEDGEGNVYLCGYYNNAPICLSAGGEFLWKAENDDQSVYWPYDIKVTDDGIDVYYDAGGTNGEGTVLSFDRTGQAVTKGNPFLSLAEAMDEEGDVVDYTYVTDMMGLRTCVILTVVSDKALTDFKVLSLEGSTVLPNGMTALTVTEKMSLARLDPGETLGAWLCMDGDIPPNAVSFYDGDGAFHRYMLDFSGENGELYLAEF